MNVYQAQEQTESDYQVDLSNFSPESGCDNEECECNVSALIEFENEAHRILGVTVSFIKSTGRYFATYTDDRKGHGVGKTAWDAVQDLQGANHNELGAVILGTRTGSLGEAIERSVSKLRRHARQAVSERRGLVVDGGLQ